MVTADNRRPSIDGNILGGGGEMLHPTYWVSSSESSVCTIRISCLFDFLVGGGEGGTLPYSSNNTLSIVDY